MRELIEKQIEEVADYLAASVRSRHGGDLNSMGLFLEEACGRLFQIVQNQQAQIDALEKRLSDTQSVVVASVVDPGGMVKALHDNSICECGHTLALHGERRCRGLNCRCRQFRLEVNR